MITKTGDGTFIRKAQPMNVDNTEDIKIDAHHLSIGGDRIGLKDILDELTSEDRVALFSHFCIACGDKNAHCHCWNDE